MIEYKQKKPLDEYYAFLRAKKRQAKMRGLARVPALNSALFDFQSYVLDFALRCGSSASFLDTGLGKALEGLDFGRVIAEHTNKPTLMLAPLAVGQQHEREAEKFGIEARYIRDPKQIKSGVNITNYERLHLFDPDAFGGLVLDESSIVKSFGGSTSKAVIEFASKIKYRLALTATPAPNDHMELGQHSQLLGAMASNEMLARWFTTDQDAMGKYRLKKHGVDDFWSWVASWARMASKPSDLGYSDDGFVLPKKTETLHYVDADICEGTGDGELIRKVDSSATSIHKEKRRTAPQRAEKVAALARFYDPEPVVIWCDTDYEQDAICELLPDAMDVRGSMKPDEKEAKLVAFSLEQERAIVTKPRIAGFGLNWQHCNNVIFAGLSFSYENYYQAIRRAWRFGQKRPVTIDIVLAETEAMIWQTIKRKAEDHQRMKAAMAEAMGRVIQERDVKASYFPTEQAEMPQWLRA